jgi:allantoinase
MRAAVESDAMSDWTPTRDFVGYGAQRPDPRWPGGARVAVQCVINYEEGSEYNNADADGRTELGLAEAPGGRVPAGRRDLAFESMYEYGSRVGFWRLMRLFRERGLPATIFGCAVALQRNPQAVHAIGAAGFDICCHGYRWEEHFGMTAEEERERIRLAVATIQSLTGQRPLGWYCRFGPSENTRRLLVEEGGFLYDSDAYNDELPYWVDVDGRQHLVVPYTMDANDGKFAAAAGGFGSPTRLLRLPDRVFRPVLCRGRAQPRPDVGRPASADGRAAGPRPCAGAVSGSCPGA